MTAGRREEQQSDNERQCQYNKPAATTTTKNNPPHQSPHKTQQQQHADSKRKKEKTWVLDVDIGDSEGLYSKQFSLLQFVVCVAQCPPLQSPVLFFPTSLSLAPYPTPTYGRFALRQTTVVVLCCATCDDVSYPHLNRYLPSSSSSYLSITAQR